VIVELSSPSTIDVDLGLKLRLYEKIFRTPEYFCYDPAGYELVGWRHHGDGYEVIEPNAQGWLWSKELGLWLGNWQGEFQRLTTMWLRFFTSEGELVRTLAESEVQRAVAEAQRAEKAEAEVARLRARLASLGADHDEAPTES
jgi:hypothetical protein